MSWKGLTLWAVVLSGLSGCGQSHSIKDVKHYDSGQLRQTGVSWHHDKWNSEDVSCYYTSEYFKDGKLSREKWVHNGNFVRKLTFHENGTLKSEEHLSNDVIVYGTYYDENGNVQKRVRRGKISATSPAGQKTTR